MCIKYFRYFFTTRYISCSLPIRQCFESVFNAIILFLIVHLSSIRILLKHFHYIFQIVPDTRCVIRRIRRRMDSTVCRNKILRNFLEHWLRLLKIVTIPHWLRVPSYYPVYRNGAFSLTICNRYDDRDQENKIIAFRRMLHTAVQLCVIKLLSIIYHTHAHK